MADAADGAIDPAGQRPRRRGVAHVAPVVRRPHQAADAQAEERVPGQARGVVEQLNHVDQRDTRVGLVDDGGRETAAAEKVRQRALAVLLEHEAGERPHAAGPGQGTSIFGQSDHLQLGFGA